MILSKKRALEIYSGEVPGLYKNIFAGNFGHYTKYEAVYADMCYLFGFVVYERGNDIMFEPVFNDSGDEIKDAVEVYPYEISVNTSTEIKRVIKK